MLVAIVLLLAGCGGTSDAGSCEPKTGECPNVCDAGPAQSGQLCSLDDRCACGLACKDNGSGSFVCQAYDGESAGCTGCEGGEPPGDTTTPPPPSNGELLGSGGAVPGAATLTVIADTLLNAPSDLEFHPDHPNQIWVANHANDSLTVIVNPGESNQKVYQFVSAGHHFLGEVVSLAFGDNETFATCGESQNEQVEENPPDFMGPVMWPADLDDFLASPGNVDGIHWDMLHDTPLCMGIAAAGGNAYYVFNGLIGVIDWYDFKEPHEPGGGDHTDGLKKRFLSPGVKREPGVPSHLDYDMNTGWLYVADTGNSRVLRLDTNTGEFVDILTHYSNENPMDLYSGIKGEQVVSAASGHLVSPSGIIRHEGVLYVTDNANGKIQAFDDAGALINSLDTGLAPGALSGLDVGPDNRLYLVDRLANRVLRVDPN